MGAIRLRTPVPGPRSQALQVRREHAVPRGLSQATPVYVAKSEGALIEDVDGAIRVLEVDAWAGFAGITEITGADVAGAILDLALARA